MSGPNGYRTALGLVRPPPALPFPVKVSQLSPPRRPDHTTELGEEPSLAMASHRRPRLPSRTLLLLRPKQPTSNLRLSIPSFAQASIITAASTTFLMPTVDRPRLAEGWVPGYYTRMVNEEANQRNAAFTAYLA